MIAVRNSSPLALCSSPSARQVDSNAAVTWTMVALCVSSKDCAEAIAPYILQGWMMPTIDSPSETTCTSAAVNEYFNSLNG